MLTVLDTVVTMRSDMPADKEGWVRPAGRAVQPCVMDQPGLRPLRDRPAAIGLVTLSRWAGDVA
jgi:hypothetical protein